MVREPAEGGSPQRVVSLRETVEEAAPQESHRHHERDNACDGSQDGHPAPPTPFHVSVFFCHARAPSPSEPLASQDGALSAAGCK